MPLVEARQRLTKEYKKLVKSPPEYITARPNESNILEWHYVIDGPPDTPYFNGQYHGVITFTSSYPYAPPSIRMFTPNGRFKTRTRLCLSMSDYHPELWNPGWSVSTILTGLLSFMTCDEMTTGSIITSYEEKVAFAKHSMAFNSTQNQEFVKMFPDLMVLNTKDTARRIAEIDAYDLERRLSRRSVASKISGTDSVKKIKSELKITNLNNNNNPDPNKPQKINNYDFGDDSISFKKFLLALSVILLGCLWFFTN